LKALHELPGFNWISLSQRARKRINRFGVLRVKRDSPPPSLDCLGFPLFLFQYMAELTKCRRVIRTQFEVALEQIPLYLRVTFITFQSGPIIQGFCILR